MTKTIKNLVDAMIKAYEEKEMNPFVKYGNLFDITRIINILWGLSEDEIKVINDYIYSLQCK